MRFLPQIGPTDLSFPQEEIQIISWQQLSGETPAYISLGMHILCGDPQESSCGSTGCSAAAGHAGEVQVFQKNTKDVQSDSPAPDANLQLVQGGEWAQVKQICALKSSFLPPTFTFPISHLQLWLSLAYL